MIRKTPKYTLFRIHEANKKVINSLAASFEE